MTKTSSITGFTLNGAEYYYRKNLQGDVTHILDEHGGVVAKYNYDAWGNHEIEFEVNGVGTLNPIRYRGYYYDNETGFYYLKSRYYDPEVGRFISMDSIDHLHPEKVNGLNLFAYCYNNPIMYVDPTGDCIFCDIWNGLKKIVSGIGKTVAGVATLFVGGIVSIFDQNAGNSILNTGYGLMNSGTKDLGQGINGIVQSIGDTFIYKPLKFVWDKIDAINDWAYEFRDAHWSINWLHFVSIPFVLFKSFF